MYKTKSFKITRKFQFCRIARIFTNLKGTRNQWAVMSTRITSLLWTDIKYGKMCG